MGTSSLDPGLGAFLAAAAASATDERPWSELSVNEARERCAAELPLTAGRGNQSVTSSDISIPASHRQVRARIYRPDASQATRAAPLVVYIHGGGFVLGSLDTHDAICRDVVAAGGFVCVSVDYRLAPEHPFPSALDDCVATQAWIGQHRDELSDGASAVVLAGDSAGGNLAAATCLVLRDRGLPLPDLQLLVYPVVDMTMSTESSRAYGPEYGLSTKDLGWFYANYLGQDGSAEDPYVSPWLASDLSGLPASHIVTVEFDPLRDEGLGYADSLRAAGVATTTADYPGLIHGAFELAAVVPASRTLLEDVAHRLSRTSG
jgi:acetyl esterase